MPVYEYLCRSCDSRFEARRAMSDAGAPIECPEGHSDTTRMLSVFASVGRAAGVGPLEVPVCRPGRRRAAAGPAAPAPPDSRRLLTAGGC